MARYRLYHLEGSQLTALDELEAGDDGEATRLARERAGGSRVEIWCGDRRVRTVAAHDAEALPPVA